MSKKFKVAAIIAVTAMILAAPVFGQSSPTGTATAGVYTTDVEDSMDVHYYSDVEFSKWAGFIGTSGTTPQLGFAKRFGKLYVGTYYTGTIANTNNYKEDAVVQNYNLATQLFTGKTTTLQYSNKYTDSNNSLDVLIGVAGMGIKVGFAENLRVWNYPNLTLETYENATGATKTINNDYIVDDYNQIYGYMTPSLEWGMSLKAGKFTLRPKVAASLDINRDTNILNVKGTYSTYNGELIGAEVLNRSNGTINDYLGLGVGAGVDVDLNEKLTVGIGYELYTEFYDNNYDGSGFTGDAAGTVSWSGGSTTINRSLAATTTTTEATLNINEITTWEHYIEPSLYYSNDIAEGLKLGFTVAVPISITAGSDTEYSEYHNNSKTEYNNPVFSQYGETQDTVTYSPKELEEISSFRIGLNTAAGAQYSLIPGRFKINAGVGLIPFTYTRTTTKNSQATNRTKKVETTYNADGSLRSEVVSLDGNPTTDEVSDSVRVSNVWNSFYVYAAGGFTFNFTNNIALDMAVNSGSASTGFTLDIANVKLLFSFKF